MLNGLAIGITVRAVLLENTAKLWLESYEAEYLHHIQTVTLAEFSYATNITEHNQQQVRE